MGSAMAIPRTPQAMLAAGALAAVASLALLVGSRVLAGSVPVLGGILANVMILLSPAPLVVAGLVAGRATCVLAAVFAATVLALTAPIESFWLQVGADGLPAVLVVHLLLAARADQAGAAVFSPPGWVLAWCTAAVAAACVLVTVILAPGGESIHGGLLAYFQGVVPPALLLLEGLPRGLGADTVEQTAAIREALVQTMASVAVGLMGMTVLLRVLIAAVIGQWIARKLGRALRPSPAYLDTRLPDWGVWGAVALVLAGGVASSFVGLDHNAAYLVASAALVAITAPKLVGIAVMHVAARRTGEATLVLTVGYILILVLGGVGIMALVVVGVADHFLDFRRRLAAGGSHLGG